MLKPGFVGYRDRLIGSVEDVVGVSLDVFNIGFAGIEYNITIPSEHWHEFILAVVSNILESLAAIPS
jgi:hypothetical protein